MRYQDFAIGFAFGPVSPAQAVAVSEALALLGGLLLAVHPLNGSCSRSRKLS